MLLILRPLHFLMSAIPFPQIFQKCTTVILLSIMWFLCSFTDWVQAFQIMRSMCRKNALLRNPCISFICIMKAGEIICPYQKDQNVKFAMGYIKGGKISINAQSWGAVIVNWSNTNKNKRDPPKKNTTFAAWPHLYLMLMLLWGVFKS